MIIPEDIHAKSKELPITGNEKPPDGRSQAYYQVVQEFRESELAFLRFITLVQKHFVPALMESKFIKISQTRTLFGNLESIIQLSKALIKELEDRSGVHIAFRHLGPFLKLYTSYVSNYKSSQKLYNKLMLRNKFRGLVESLEEHPDCNGLKLSAFLIMPIQRVPRYILLLKRLIEETNCEEERAELDEVFSQLQDITCVIESCIQDYEEAEKLWKVQNDLGLRDEIVAPGRKLLREGPLHKKRGGDQGYSERQFWLFTDILVYGKRKFGLGPLYEPALILPLRHIDVNFSELDGTLMVKCKSHTLALTSASYETLREWFVDCSAAIENCNVLRSTLRKESSRQEVRDFRHTFTQRLQATFLPSSWCKYSYAVSDFWKQESSASASTTMASSSTSTSHSSVEGRQLRDLPSATSNNRKRRAPTAFDQELDEVLQRRRVNNEPEQPEALAVRMRSVNSKPAGNHDADVGVDEVDRAARNSRTYSRCRADVLRRRQTMQPRIKGLTIAPPAPPSCDDSVATDDDEPRTSQDQPRRRPSSLPWWVEECEPITFARRQEKAGFIDRMKSQCSVM